MTIKNVHYRVRIEYRGYDRTGPWEERELLHSDTETERFPSLSDARNFIKIRLPVSIGSGDPMHYDTGDGDVMGTGRIYHYWRDTHDGGSLWMDTWVSVEKETVEFIKYDDVLAVE